jgi:hypothetical protein
MASSVLVEFLGILLSSFYPTLRALQRTITKPDLHSSDLVAPTDKVKLATVLLSHSTGIAANDHQAGRVPSPLNYPNRHNESRC